MCGLKCSIRVVAIALIIQSGHLISTGPHNGTAEILWNLSHLAIQGRQTTHPSHFQLHPEKFSQYTGPIKPKPTTRRPVVVQNYPRQDYLRPNPGFYQPHPVYPGFPRPVPALPPGYQQHPQGFMDALDSIAQNDELRCVPRLLCELTSGPPGQKKDSILPFNINMDSLLGLLSGIGGATTSPLLQFGRAVLLGYTSKGNTGSCMYAYPRCPQDPDRLVDYLNNHNGGFFRFFNGLPQLQPGYPQNPQQPFFSQPSPQYPQLPQQYPQYPQIPQRYPQYPQQILQKYPQIPQRYPQYPQYPQQNPYYTQYLERPQRYPQNFNYIAQKRILTKPAQYTDSNQGVKFPHFSYDINNEVVPQQESVVFPYDDEQQVRDHRNRKQKAVAFPLGDFQRPLPNFKPAKMIFPDRTGTGELRLDAEELESNSDYEYFPQVNYGYYRNVKEINYDDFRFPLNDRDA